jgi:hypothetical protein
MGIVRLSSIPIGNISIIVAAKAPKKTNFIFIPRFILTKTAPIRKHRIKQARLPSRDLPLILALPNQVPDIAAIASPNTAKVKAVMAIAFWKRKIVNKDAIRKRVVPEIFLFSFSLRIKPKYLNIPRLIAGWRNLKISAATIKIIITARTQRASFLSVK